MSNKNDVFYPAINFNFKTKIIQHERTNNWKWQCTLLIEGPDDLFERESAWFGSKKEAVENLLLKVQTVFNEMIEKMGEL